MSTTPDQTPAEQCEQHPSAPRIGGKCGGCTQYPADMTTAEQHVDREPAATVTLRPIGDDEITLTAESYGMAPARVAYGLRMAADTFDVRARAAGDEPIPYGPAAKQQRAAVPDRPALALLTEIYEELGHDHRAPHLAAALLDQHARDLAEQVTALGKARGWSTWAADYIHPECEFVDTGEDAEEPAHVWVTALDDNDRPARDSAGNTWQHCGICGKKKTEQQRPAIDPDENVTLVPYRGEHGYPAGESPEEQPADWVADVRAAITFNLPEREPALETLRDVLLDTAPRTPEQALTAARLILAAHTRDQATAVRKYINDYSAEHGVNRSTRGLITGMGSIRRLLDQRADALDAEAQQ
ncbi:hypothetical protein [Streptomyces sp. NPDC102370]|uniref:hypothetical protein n=1 Tax=Streptomyces sp. NPDC102370 TaxID=3366163 RepID=UPI0038162293